MARPYLEPLGEAPEVMVERGLDGSDVVLLALLLLIVPPLLLAGIVGLVARASERAGAVLGAVSAGGLVALIVWQALDERFSSSAPAYTLALAAGALAAFALRRSEAVRSGLTALAPAPIVVGALFLLASPAAALVTGGEPAAAAPQGGSEAPVVVVVFDELPTGSLMDARGRIEGRRYPGFAALAREATWYRQAASVGDYTQLAVPALLTGRRVRRGPAPVAAEHPRSLFTLLGRSHRVDASEQLTALCPRSACPQRVRPGLAERLRSVLEEAVRTIPALPPRPRRTAADLLAPEPRRPPPTRRYLRGVSRHERLAQGTRFERFLRTLDGGPRTLGFLHVELPHRPWRFLPDGRPLPEGLRAAGGDGFGRWPRDRALVKRAWRRHLLQTGYADTLLRRLIRRLRALGAWDRTLVVVSADHGTSFIPGEEARVATRANAGDVGFVPLFVKRPMAQGGRIDDRPAETLDLLPEIARVLRVRLPWPVEGRPLSGPAQRRPTLTIERQRGGSVTVARSALRRRRAGSVRQALRLPYRP